MNTYIQIECHTFSIDQMAVLARGALRLASIRVQALPRVAYNPPLSSTYHEHRQWLQLPRNRKGAIALSQRWMRSSKF